VQTSTVVARRRIRAAGSDPSRASPSRRFSDSIQKQKGDTGRQSRITEGQRANLLLLGLTLLVINLLGAILFGLGLLITVPVSALAAIHVYRILRTAADAAPNTITPVSAIT